MLAYYRYKVEKGMITLEQVPEPYQSMLREEAAAEPPVQG
jgi:hypothetical protein